MSNNIFAEDEMIYGIGQVIDQKEILLWFLWEPTGIALTHPVRLLFYYDVERRQSSRP
jgi:hypothetical protein